MSKKRLMSKFLCLLLLVAMLLPTVATRESHAAGFMKCYTISSGYTKVYTSASFRTKLGTIYPTDELQLREIQKSYVKVTYPAGNRTKTGYIPTSAVLLATGGNTKEASRRITTYRRNSTSRTYGYIDAGDKVIVLGTKGTFIQVCYPVSGGNKIGWIRSSDASWRGDENPRPISNGLYRLESASGKRMDVNGASRADCANIQLWEKNDSDAQIFRIECLNNGYYKITNAGSGKSLDVDGGRVYNSANIIQYSWHGGSNQQWKIVSSGSSGYYQILSRLNTNKAVDIAGGVFNNGTNIQLWDKNQSNAQKWRFVPYNGNPTPTTTSEITSPVPAGCKFSKKTYDGSWYGYHDINRNVSYNTPVYAIADGTVTYKQAYRTYNGIKYLTSYGNFIEFKASSGGYTAKYCHLNRFVGANQYISSSKTKQVSGSTATYTITTRNVRKGEVIGYIGTTGNSSGIHLHFELKKNGSRIDPTSVFGGLV